jgi:hypothetical protein
MTYDTKKISTILVNTNPWAHDTQNTVFKICFNKDLHVFLIDGIHKSKKERGPTNELQRTDNTEEQEI